MQLEVVGEGWLSFYIEHVELMIYPLPKFWFLHFMLHHETESKTVKFVVILQEFLQDITVKNCWHLVMPGLLNSEDRQNESYDEFAVRPVVDMTMLWLEIMYASNSSILKFEVDSRINQEGSG